MLFGCCSLSFFRTLASHPTMAHVRSWCRRCNACTLELASAMHSEDVFCPACDDLDNIQSVETWLRHLRQRQHECLLHVVLDFLPSMLYYHRINRLAEFLRGAAWTISPFYTLDKRYVSDRMSVLVFRDGLYSPGWHGLPNTYTLSMYIVSFIGPTEKTLSHVRTTCRPK